ncbi:MAG: hypothetical protein ABI743_06800, partial [bacterium]
MFQRTLSLSALAVAVLGITACGGGGGTAPALQLPSAQSPASQSPNLPAVAGQLPGSDLVSNATILPDAVSALAGLGAVLGHGGTSQSALAIYTVDIDANALAATAHLKQTRSAQANDDLYLLSIEQFLKPTSFRIVGVGASPTTIDLTWELEHPFAGPSDPTGTPNGASNRADLGISGQVVFLTDVAAATGNTFFDESGTGGGQVVANTGLVANADAFIAPGGLLDLTSAIANTFPAQSLVDETSGTGSRVATSNGGIVTGNFGTDGWTRTELGGTHDQWSGYGVLHQGQTTRRKVSLDKAALLAAGGFSLDVGVIAKYADPRG